MSSAAPQIKSDRNVVVVVVVVVIVVVVVVVVVPILDCDYDNDNEDDLRKSRDLRTAGLGAPMKR